VRHSAQTADKRTKKNVNGVIALTSAATAVLAQLDKGKANSLTPKEANIVSGVSLGALAHPVLRCLLRPG
jgi:hypothetical protein